MKLYTLERGRLPDILGNAATCQLPVLKMHVRLCECNHRGAFQR